MAMEVKCLVNFPDVYFKKYEAVIKNGFTMKDDMKKRDMRETFEMINNDDKPELRILAIGTGEGLVDEGIIDVVSVRFKSVVYVVVDPAESELQKFKDMVTLRNDKEQWKNVHFEFLCTRIEGYLEKRKKEEVDVRFHVIHAFHCMYHFTDPHGILLQLYDMLEKGGMLITMLVSGPWEQTAGKVGEYYFDPTQHFFGPSVVRRKFEEQIKDAKIVIKYRAKTIRINTIFDEESEEGNDVLDFITQIPEFRKTAPKEVFDDVFTVIKDNCEQSGSGNDIQFGADEEDMLIFKQ